jgi:transposase
MGKKRTFTQEFKKEAANLVLEHGYTITKACESMGVSESAMRRWVNQLKAEQGGLTPRGSRALTEEQNKIQGLEKRIIQLEREKDILKKASALLMLDQYQSTL